MPAEFGPRESNNKASADRGRSNVVTLADVALRDPCDGDQSS